MADNLTKEQRRKNMQAIKSHSNLEKKVTQALWKNGIRFRKNVKTLPGKPDISIKKFKIVIFIDSCFWHQCNIHGNMPKSNLEYWTKKLKRNCERDIEVNDFYQKRNWNLLRVWEHELKNDFIGTVNKIISFINENKKS
ncbi:very short patch repair endonuclease [Bacillus sp. NEB1478]|uniref:very short patch repair endonuclease n=1 Tax=Bacillus sp. NEB1478 TaxID=3073816 RepID=UPI002872B0CA|nr:very short patch repair endonuclease [Bacillus sp. NEB1478]WNB93425.1 very short patch repair endonuclease [Bacillus sp. NEB1478]